MKFFTPDVRSSWYQRSEFELIEQAHEAYQSHLERLSKKHHRRVIVDLARLSSVGDGLIVHVKHNRKARKLSLTLRCGDSQMGYYDLIIHYTDASIDPEHDLALAQIARSQGLSELWRHEVDEEGEYGEDAIVHRLFFHHEPDLWFEIRCQWLDWERKPRPNRTLQPSSNRYPTGPV